VKASFRSLNEILSFRGGGTPRKDVPEYWSDEIPWASVKDFKSLDLSRTQDSISRKGLVASASNLIPAGHVIIPTRMALGKAAINSIDMAINQDLRALIPKVPLDSRYLLHSMIGLADEIVRYGSGATVKGITQENLGKLQIPLPPLTEQKRIAAILDAANALRTRRREALAQLDALLQSTFLTLFGDPVSNSKRWESRKFSSLRTNVQIGPFGSLLHKEDYIEGGIPLINPMHILSGKVVVREGQTISEKKAATLEGYRLRNGDVIMGRRGEMGRCAVIGEQEQGMICGTGSLFLRPDPNEFTSLFLFSLMSSESMKRKLNELAWGVTMPNLNRTMIEDLAVLLPPLPLQQKFETIVESIDRQKTTQRTHLAELDALFAALQHRAFRGEL
jgi:type I restriction enzyme, S subunit